MQIFPFLPANNEESSSNARPVEPGPLKIPPWKCRRLLNCCEIRSALTALVLGGAACGEQSFGFSTTSPLHLLALIEPSHSMSGRRRRQSIRATHPHPGANSKIPQIPSPALPYAPTQSLARNRRPGSGTQALVAHRKPLCREPIGGLDRRSGSRLFQISTGTSMARCLRVRRLTEAARTPGVGSEPILDVAPAVSYASHAAFTHAFTEQFKLPGNRFARTACTASRCWMPSSSTLHRCPARWRRYVAGRAAAWGAHPRPPYRRYHCVHSFAMAAVGADPGAWQGHLLRSLLQL